MNSLPHFATLRDGGLIRPYQRRLRLRYYAVAVAIVVGLAFATWAENRIVEAAAVEAGE